MLIKGKEKDRQRILDYCLSEPIVNTFIIGDIENFGFSSEIQDVWYESQEDKIIGVILRYHTMLIVYSQNLNMDFKQIESIIDSNNIELISGKKQVMDKLYSKLKARYSRKDSKLCKFTGDYPLIDKDLELSIAGPDDAMDIALAYGDIEEFKSMYSPDVNIRFNQIYNRIVSGEGIHVFIKEKGTIIAHGNTSAENSFSAMIGGLFTREDRRNNGYGSLIISYLTRYLLAKNKEVALFYEDDKYDSFFGNNGFEKISDWTLLRREIDE